MPDDTPKIFISYARDDSRDIAMRLHADLASAGHDVWLDLSEIEIGASWSRDIEEAIETSEIVLALLSAGSYVSEICRAEQLRALRKGKRIIPVLVQTDADRPLHLENLNYLDFSNMTLYGVTLPDLFKAISSGQIPSRRLDPTTTSTLPSVKPATSRKEKRDSRAFRRYLEDLREEPWLGARYWWPYFLFYFGDVHEIAATLKSGILYPPAHKQSILKPQTVERWDYNVRLYMRPRTPDLFSGEGIRPAGVRGGSHCPVPVYLLFDMDTIITHPDTRFSDGDVTQTKKTYKAASAFRDLPFDLIYHDSWFRNDEREEIMSARRAQVIVPTRLDLDALNHVWCRSSAEYDMLRSLLPSDVWLRWKDKITTRTDYNLFNRKWLYVDEATLTADSAHFRFNPCDARPAECGGFTARIEINTPESATIEKVITDFSGDDIHLDLKHTGGAYTVRLYLDDALVYAGHCEDAGQVVF